MGGGGVDLGILQFFCEKSRAPPHFLEWIIAWPFRNTPIERGKCACGECEDFMRSDGATCGYCGCLPTRHSKKDARYSSDSIGGTSAARTSESASSEKWKDEDLGWFPNPCKGRIYWILKWYSAKILPVLLDHLSLQGTLSPLFRQGEVREALKVTNHRTPRGNIKIWARADTGRERQIC